MVICRDLCPGNTWIARDVMQPWMEVPILAILLPLLIFWPAATRRYLGLITTVFVECAFHICTFLLVFREL